MSFPVNFKFPYQVTGGVTDLSCVCSPVQTIAGGTDWLSNENTQTVTTSDCQSAAIKSDGTLWLWGDNTAGKLGNNSTIDQSSPVQTVSTGTNWKQVSLGCFHSAAIKTDGTLWLWGDNTAGKLGNNATANRSSPVQTVSTTTNWKQVSLGCDHSAAIKTDGTLWIWGVNNKGQLGDNTVSSKSSPIQTVTTGTNWKQVSLGTTHSAAVKIDGTLWIWGYNLSGQLGNNSTIDRSSPVQTVSTGTNWEKVSLGSATNPHSAAVKTDGTLWLWGNSGCGRLGNNNNNDVSSPVQTVSTGTNWKQVSLGDRHSAAIKTDGTLWLWGYSSNGQLGNNDSTNTDKSSPVQTVSTGTNWKQVSLGVGITITNKVDGTLWLWGDNNCGQLGNNSTANQSSPVQTVSNVTTWTSVGDQDVIFASSLGSDYSAAIKTDGTLWLWGNGTDGKLGNNSTTDQSSPVQTVSTGTNWKQVSLSSSQSTNQHSAAIKTDGTLWLWGNGSSGRLGNNDGGAGSDRSSPVQTVSTGTNWKQVSLGGEHSAAIKTDGTLWLWGNGTDGKLGNNATSSRSSPVQTISGGTNWKQVSLGDLHSAAIKTDGTLWGWGNNQSGQLGNNSNNKESSPVQTVSTGTNWKQVSLGNAQSAAIKTDGTLWLWGNGDDGKLGNNAVANQSSPVQTVSTGTNWKQVSSGVSSSTAGSLAAIKTDGTLWMWGDNACGKLGNGNTIDQSSPVQTVCTGTNWQELPEKLGLNHSGATAVNNELYLWGNNVSGQLGIPLTCGFTTSVCADFDDVFVRREIFSQGGLWGWGCGLSGILGNNSTINQSSPVQTVSGGTNWKQVSAGNEFLGAVKTDGTLWLWGCNVCGRLGNNSTINQSSPVQTVSAVTTWKQVSLGCQHSGAIKTDGTLWLWGLGTCGRLGTNDTINVSSPVQTVSTATNWKQVSLGVAHSAAIKTDGTLWLWGCNVCGRLGNNSTINQSSPVQTVSATNCWKQVSLGCGYAGAIKTDGTLWLWGCGASGILGNNNTTPQSSPVQTVSNVTTWKQVSLGCLHSAAIKTDGTLWLWGDGTLGKLGNNNTVDVSSPIQTIISGNNWKQVSLKFSSSAAIKTDGTLWLWGSGSCGRLGDNTTAAKSSPVQTVSTGTNWIDVSFGDDNASGIREDCY